MRAPIALCLALAARSGAHTLSQRLDALYPDTWAARRVVAREAALSHAAAARPPPQPTAPAGWDDEPWNANCRPQAPPAAIPMAGDNLV
jgi:hypothetical protein